MTRFFEHFVLIILGYVFAVLVASSITILMMSFSDFFSSSGPWSPTSKTFLDLPRMIAIGGCITAVFALPGWLITVLIAEYENGGHRYWFGLAGFLTAMSAIFMGVGSSGGMLAEPIIIIGSLIGGLLGGLTYWAVAGKRSGGWKQ